MDYQLLETVVVAFLSAAAAYFSYRVYEVYRDKRAAIGWLAVTISLVIMLVRRLLDFYAIANPASSLAMIFDSYDWAILSAVSLTQIYAFLKVRELVVALDDERKKVEELSKAKENFMDAITHELKTPLAVILANLYMLRNVAPKGREKEWKASMVLAERNSVRLRHSIDQILAVRKIESLELQKGAVDLESAVRDVYAEYAPLAETKGLKFSLSACAAEVSGDAELLRMALSNFVSNAVKFTEKGGVRVSLAKAEGGYAFTVRDTGIGISPQDKRRLFLKFFKADPQASGSGMGMWLAAEIIKKHKGKITVESRPGRGTAFTVWLPGG